MDILFLSFITFAIALSAFVFTNILTADGQILQNVQDYLERHLPEKIYKPLIGCELCVSGQWALWFYLYFTLIEQQQKYHWWLHIWVVMQTIFIARLISYLYYNYITD